MSCGLAALLRDGVGAPRCGRPRSEVLHLELVSGSDTKGKEPSRGIHIPAASWMGHGSALSQRFVELSWFEKGKNKQLMRGQIPNSVLFLLILQHCSFHISLMGSRPSAVFFFQLTLCWTSPDAQTQLCIFGLRNKFCRFTFFQLWRTPEAAEDAAQGSSSTWPLNLPLMIKFINS